MKKRNILLVVILIFSVNITCMGVFISATSNSITENSRESSIVMGSLDGHYAMDLSFEELGEKEIAIRKLASKVGAKIATKATPTSGNPAEFGDQITIRVSDSGLGNEYDETFVVILDGIHGIILIEEAAYLNYDPIADAYIFPNPAGTWRDNDTITTTQLSYMLNEFDTNIYPTDVAIFGEPLARGDEGQKVWILIHNIRDEAYYDSEAESYIAGYFSASEDADNNKNMMHIDSYAWQDRTGPDSARPFLYEGVFAHEFEHLIHFDVDPNEPSWVDEGLADMAGYMCGYGQPSGHIMYYMAYHHFTPLTFWGGGLEDYGASYLFQLYLYERFGGADFVTALVQEQANGIEGIENTLAKLGYCEKFDDIFDAWTVANYLDDTSLSNGKYGYETLEIGSADTNGWTIESSLDYWGAPFFNNTEFNMTSDWFYGMEPMPYTAQYYRYTDTGITEISIDGDDFAGTLPNSGTYEWYSDALAWAWRGISQTFEIPTGGATLEFYTYYEIEEDWDYGYVEVYDHDSGEWYTLGCAETVDYLSHPQDNPNTPDNREPMYYETVGRWNGFTGNSGGWIPISMNLTPFAGHTIDIHFRTWQDGAFTLQMMYIDDISIPEIGFSDDVESGEGNWIVDEWYVTDGILDNGFDVTLVTSAEIPIFGNTIDIDLIYSMYTDAETQSGSMIAFPIRENWNGMHMIIASNHADHILSSHYDLSVEKISFIK